MQNLAEVFKKFEASQDFKDGKLIIDGTHCSLLDTRKLIEFIKWLQEKHTGKLLQFTELSIHDFQIGENDRVVDEGGSVLLDVHTAFLYKIVANAQKINHKIVKADIVARLIHMLPNLSTITLKNNGMVAKESLTVIREIIRKSNLRSLILDMNNLCDECAMALSKYLTEKECTLKVLSISRCLNGKSVAARKIIQGLTNNVVLRKLDLTGCELQTQDDATVLYSLFETNKTIVELNYVDPDAKVMRLLKENQVRQTEFHNSLALNHLNENIVHHLLQDDASWLEVFFNNKEIAYNPSTFQTTNKEISQAISTVSIQLKILQGQKNILDNIKNFMSFTDFQFLQQQFDQHITKIVTDCEQTFLQELHRDHEASPESQRQLNNVLKRYTTEVLEPIINPWRIKVDSNATIIDLKTTVDASLKATTEELARLQTKQTQLHQARTSYEEDKKIKFDHLQKSSLTSQASKELELEEIIEKICSIRISPNEELFPGETPLSIAFTKNKLNSYILMLTAGGDILKPNRSHMCIFNEVMINPQRISTHLQTLEHIKSSIATGFSKFTITEQNNLEEIKSVLLHYLSAFTHQKRRPLAIASTQVSSTRPNEDDQLILKDKENEPDQALSIPAKALKDFLRIANQAQNGTLHYASNSTLSAEVASYRVEMAKNFPIIKNCVATMQRQDQEQNRAESSRLPILPRNVELSLLHAPSSTRTESLSPYPKVASSANLDELVCSFWTQNIEDSKTSAKTHEPDEDSRLTPQ